MLRPRRALGFWLSQILWHLHTHDDGMHTWNSRFTRYTQTLKEWVNVTGTWAVTTAVTWSQVGMLHLCPGGRGGGTCTKALMGRSALAFCCGSGAELGHRACTASVVTQWAISLAQILAHLVFPCYTQPAPLSPHKHTSTKVETGDFYNNWYDLCNYTFRPFKTQYGYDLNL